MIQVSSNPHYSLSASQTVKSSAAIGGNGNKFAQTLRGACAPSKSMDDMFTQAAAVHQVPKELIQAIAFHESRYKPEVVSTAGAMGVMQLMPATAQTMGVKDPFDAEQNIMGGANLLGQLLQKYDGDIKLTLAAYGAGSGSVAKYNGVPPFEETQNFVEDIMSVMGQDIYFPTPAPNMPSSSPYNKVVEEIRSFDSYSSEDYQIFLAMLLESSKNTSNDTFYTNSDFPVLF